MTAVPAYLEAGKAARVLVFLHGIGGGKEGWQRSLEHFAGRGWRALAWDMPGYGGSAALHLRDFVGLAAALERLLDAAAVDRAVLVGHSLGGMVALEAWARMPSRIEAMVLAATSPAFGSTDGEFQRQFLAQRLAPLDQGRTMAEVAAPLIPSMAGPGADPEGVALARTLMSRIPPASYRAALQALVRFDRRAVLPEIRVPVLCLAGEHDKTAPPQVLRRMAGKIPGAVCAEIPGAGHLLNFERPAEFHAALEPFLNKL
ncbi:MAG TPA: alpha/beta fold hydrolase [Rhodocyclaceae bacterium]|nr:alpha/beta fold hydrolase [Rhodocyclaceae bacterium]